MKKTSEFTLLKVPLAKAIKTNLRVMTDVYGLRMKLWLGPFAGEAFVYPIPRDKVRKIIHRIESFLIPFYSEKMCRIAEGEYGGPSFWRALSASEDPIHRAALAIIDIAFWDGITKLAGISLKRFIKNKKKSVEVYGTTGWISLTDDELLAECDAYRALGVKGFKVRLGRADDAARLRKLRAHVGADFHLMADANMRYDGEDHLPHLADLKEFNLKWIEEPLNQNDLPHYRALKNVLPTDIALGENLFNFDTFEMLLKSGLISVIQPDLLRCGGISGLLYVMHLAEKYDVSICNHLLAPLTATVISRSSKAVFIEYDNLLPLEFFKNDFSIKNGHLTLPTVPGVGTALNDKEIRTSLC
jgi:L-alanine-DL-glutamate epimerase-like enolase superfamily enzyme